MRILYITSNNIFENSGGGIEAKKIFNSLQTLVESYNNYEFNVISLDKDIKFKAGINLTKNKFKDFLARGFFHSNFLYLELNKVMKYIFEFKPDIIIIGNSRLGFIAEEIRKKNYNCYLIGHFDNIELDYIDSYALKYNKMFSRIFKFVERISVRKDELSLLKNMDLGIFLTKRDVNRAKDLYEVDFRSKIIPICLEKQGKIELKEENSFDLNLIFLGSLWYGSNINALEWFLENVWNQLLKKDLNISFIIGGSDPSKDFKKYLNSFDNVFVYPNFQKKSDIIPKNSIFVSPIQNGAGMKVKVADALSIGLGIIGSKETFVGYEEALGDDLSEGVLNIADSPVDYINRIIGILKHQQLENLRNSTINLFNKYYSINRAKEEFKRIISYFDDEN